MEPAVKILESVLTFLVQIMTFSNEPLILAGASFLFIFVLIMLYKKGHWLGIPLSMAGILIAFTTDAPGTAPESMIFLLSAA